MPDQDQDQKQIQKLKEEIAEVRKTKPMCSGHWENEFKLMELEDELAELTAAQKEKAGK